MTNTGHKILYDLTFIIPKNLNYECYIQYNPRKSYKSHDIIYDVAFETDNLLSFYEQIGLKLNGKSLGNHFDKSLEKKATVKLSELCYIFNILNPGKSWTINLIKYNIKNLNIKYNPASHRKMKFGNIQLSQSYLYKINVLKYTRLKFDPFLNTKLINHTDKTSPIYTIYKNYKNYKTYVSKIILNDETSLYNFKYSQTYVFDEQDKNTAFYKLFVGAYLMKVNMGTGIMLINKTFKYKSSLIRLKCNFFNTKFFYPKFIKDYCSKSSEKYIDMRNVISKIFDELFNVYKLNYIPTIKISLEWMEITITHFNRENTTYDYSISITHFDRSNVTNISNLNVEIICSVKTQIFIDNDMRYFTTIGELEKFVYKPEKYKTEKYKTIDYSIIDIDWANRYNITSYNVTKNEFMKKFKLLHLDNLLTEPIENPIVLKKSKPTEKTREPEQPKKSKVPVTTEQTREQEQHKKSKVSKKSETLLPSPEPLGSVNLTLEMLVMEIPKLRQYLNKICSIDVYVIPTETLNNALLDDTQAKETIINFTDNSLIYDETNHLKEEDIIKMVSR